jgi:hypothetical protein
VPRGSNGPIETERVAAKEQNLRNGDRDKGKFGAGGWNRQIEGFGRGSMQANPKKAGGKSDKGL